MRSLAEVPEIPAVSPTLVVLVALVAAQWLAIVLLARLLRRERRGRRQRRVEAPNSQYLSPYVMDIEARERWEALDLSRLHELNREEIEKLLGKVRATGVRSLTGGERAFLDRMSEAHDRAVGRRGAAPTPPRQLPRPS